MSGAAKTLPQTRGLSKRYALVTASCCLSLLLGVAASLAFGSRSLSLEDIIGGLTHDIPATLGETVVQRRIPRTIFGLMAGAALGMSGALMQAITRNPLADPGILGVNTGAALFVVAGIAFLGISTPGQYIVLALCGAALSAVFVYAVGSIGGRGATPVKLALAGSATSAALSSLISAIMLPRAAVMDAFRFWQVGRIGGATWDGIRSVAPFLAAGALLGLCSLSALNALALGDDVAAGLGLRVGRARLIAAAAGVMLCGATTALAGPIAFVGLMVPHVIRLAVGVDQRWIIPLSAAGGAAILLYSDVIGRLLGRPGELEAGIVTAFLGAPVLIYVAARTKVRDL
ncbi:MAG: iron chelate uptake ABC transporter family permease subunit [Spirochaetaceae bacterium]|jgi:iron complex transport system permease protein|nr:iron chelate uptake ABC transporter family permease subunit [Spirochaetaceae bacterium]